jgi:outer membrane protein assembly factor BamB
VHHAIAAGDAVYVAGLRGDAPVLHRLDASGAPSWTFDSRADIHRDHWPTLDGDRIVLDDDGLYVIDTATGEHEGRGLDSWGQSATDGERLYVTNTWQEDGPGLYAAAYDAAGKMLWKTDRFAGRGIVIPDLGGIAVGEHAVVHAANYRFPSCSGVFALEPRTGEHRWEAKTMPVSAPSTSAGLVYTVERMPAAAADALVAREEATGAPVWTADVDAARGPSPVVAAGLVVVHEGPAVVAFDAKTGARAWTAGVPRTPSATGSATSLAAALGSGTLIATSGGSVHVLSLRDGHEIASSVPSAGASDVHSPVVVGTSVYVVADGTLVRLDEAEAAR